MVIDFLGQNLHERVLADGCSIVGWLCYSISDKLQTELLCRALARFDIETEDGKAIKSTNTKYIF